MFVFVTFLNKKTNYVQMTFLGHSLINSTHLPLNTVNIYPKRSHHIPLNLRDNMLVDIAYSEEDHEDLLSVGSGDFFLGSSCQPWECCPRQSSH